MNTGLPKFLYKYMPKPLFLNNGMFRFTQPTELNDPDEAIPDLAIRRYTEDDYAVARLKAQQAGFYNMSDDDLEMMFLAPYPSGRLDEKTAPGLWPATVPELRDEPFQTIDELDEAIARRAVLESRKFVNENIGILSLTAVPPRQHTMFAYYAENHTGVAIEFNCQHEFFAKANRLSQMIYSDDPVYVSSNGGMVRIGGIHLNRVDILRGMISDVPWMLFLRKKSGWSHEKEWRMIKPLRECDARLNKDGLPICLFKIPSDAISGLIFGSKARNDFKRGIFDKIQRQPQWTHLKCREIVQDDYGKIEERDVTL